MPRAGTRTIPAPTPTILPATDLGRVEIAKHGNLYLLTDGQGDILKDGRGLGLYDLDTRILSTSILRLNGERLTLLRGPHASDGADTIQLTNPEPRHGPHEKQAVAVSLARRDLERHPDAADRRRPRGTPHDRQLFGDRPVDRHRARRSVSTWPTSSRSAATSGRARTLRPIELDGDRRCVRVRRTRWRPPVHLGLRRSRRPRRPGRPIPRPGRARRSQLAWDGTLAPGARMTVGWRVEAAGRGVADVAASRVAEMGVTTSAPAHGADRGTERADCRAGGAAPHPDDLDRQRAARPDDRAVSCRPGPAAERRPRRPASTTSPQGSRGSRRCSVATASSPPSRPCRSCRPTPSTRSTSSPAARRRDDDPGRRGARQDPPRAAQRRDGPGR